MPPKGDFLRISPEKSQHTVLKACAFFIMKNFIYLSLITYDISSLFLIYVIAKIA